MAARRVFLIWTHPIFHDSVRLLLRHPDVEWVGATSDYAAAKDEILSLRPDTVLIEEVKGRVLVEVMEILRACTWNVRVASLSLADNKSTVYHREQRVVGKVDDLLRLILVEGVV